MSKQKRIDTLKFTKHILSRDTSWPSNAVVPQTQDQVDALNELWFSQLFGPTKRQKTLSRLTGRSPDEFIP